MTQSTIDSEVEAILDEYLGSQWNGNMRTAITNLVAQEANKAVLAELQNLVANHAMVQTGPKTYKNDNARLGAAVRRRFLDLTADKESA